jgi:hypothetical protein
VRSAIHTSPSTTIGAIARDFRKLRCGGHRLILQKNQCGIPDTAAPESERLRLAQMDMTLVSQQLLKYVIEIFRDDTRQQAVISYREKLPECSGSFLAEA